jgi:hypothetical protein
MSLISGNACQFFVEQSALDLFDLFCYEVIFQGFTKNRKLTFGPVVGFSKSN